MNSTPLRYLIRLSLAAGLLLGVTSPQYAEIVDDFDELETATPAGSTETSSPGPGSSGPGGSSGSSGTDLGGDQPAKPPKTRANPKKHVPKPSPAKPKKGRSAPSTRVMKTAPESDDKTDRNSPITYKASKVLTFKTAKDYSVLNLEKDVFIRQGRLTLSSNKAKVYLRPRKGEANSIDSITIEGNVQVQKSSRIPANRVAARGDRAVFRNAQRTVVLTGNAVVVKGEQVVRGNRISYDLRTGNITISGAKGTLKPGGLN